MDKIRQLLQLFMNYFNAISAQQRQAAKESEKIALLNYLYRLAYCVQLQIYPALAQRDYGALMEINHAADLRIKQAQLSDDKRLLWVRFEVGKRNTTRIAAIILSEVQQKIWDDILRYRFELLSSFPEPVALSEHPAVFNVYQIRSVDNGSGVYLDFFIKV